MDRCYLLPAFVFWVCNLRNGWLAQKFSSFTILILNALIMMRADALLPVTCYLPITIVITCACDNPSIFGIIAMTGLHWSWSKYSTRMASLASLRRVYALLPATCLLSLLPAPAIIFLGLHSLQCLNLVYPVSLEFSLFTILILWWGLMPCCLLPAYYHSYLRCLR